MTRPVDAGERELLLFELIAQRVGESVGTLLYRLVDTHTHDQMHATLEVEPQVELRARSPAGQRFTELGVVLLLLFRRFEVEERTFPNS